MGLLTSLLIAFFSLVALNAGFCNGGCIERERQALLKLKQDLVDPAGRLTSWVADDEDCCRWEGVVCHNVTGHVLKLNLRHPTADYEANDISGLGGKISPSLLGLKHLRYLDLSYNDFREIHIPKFIGSLRSLRLLNLSDSGFVGEVPHHLGNLSNLKYLGLGSEVGVAGLHVENFHWLSGLSSLQYLHMSLVNLSKASNWFHVINTLPSLLELQLASCELGSHDQVHPITTTNLSSLHVLDLSGNFFVNLSNINWVFGLKKLIFLDLSLNNFEGEIPFESIGKLCNLRFLSFSSFSTFSDVDLSQNISDILEIVSKCIFNSLESLHLYSCQLSGQLTNKLGNFKLLRKLDLSDNSISGPIPTSLGELQSLEVLRLDGNQLNGSLPESFGQLVNLKFVSISDNSFDGSLPESFNQLVNLKYVYISNNFFDGSLPESFGQLVSLDSVDISHNSFDGSLPESLGQLANLFYFDMSHNSFKGTISEIHFVNLKKLKYFVAHENPSMILKVGFDWVPHFQIYHLELASWHLGPQFPQWLSSQKDLNYLDISDSKIVDIVPSWFWEMSSQFVYLNISHNQISGHLPSMLNSASPTVFLSVAFHFNSNNFIGPLSRISSNVAFLDLSNNKLSGSLFNCLCHERNESMAMKFLNLGQNFLFGELPDCWTKWPRLEAIVLTNNRLTGRIPRSIGTLSHLVSLHLQRNYLSGELPLSLSHCTELEMLQLGENEFNGSIPPWMGRSLSNLIILSLGSNEFSGHIPNELCSLNSLQILDLAHNNLFGSLPRCIGNMSVLLSRDNHTQEFNFGFPLSRVVFLGPTSDLAYLENAFVSIKGQLLDYDKTLYLVKIMDFSGNNLSGEIPSEITSLQGLQSLNLSHNLFIGRIPESIGNMRMLESADFSWNKLSGSIPESMSSLTFLSYLNLSNNQLTGRIPSGTQLQSFNASSYAGNKLCGLPLPDNCSVNGNSVPAIEKRGGKHANRVGINWLFVSMALGFIVGFWSVVSPLVISRRWRCRYYQFLEELWWKINDSVIKCF